MANTNQKYNTRILKGGALLDDMRMLVRSWEEVEGADAGAEAHRLLGKKTLARSRDTLVRAFTPRFIHGDPPNAWRIVRLLEERGAEPEVLIPVYYWITARSDNLLYEFVTEELIHVARSGDGSVRIDETTAWISRHIGDAGQEWSPTVTLKVGRGILAALRDFGILEGGSKKRVAPVHLPLDSFCYIAFWLARLGFSGASLVNHTDWRLFLMSPQIVERLMLEAHQQRLLDFNSAGRIYRVDFPKDDPGEYADVLFG
ncbi:Putative inner membrane protein [Desulfatibacillum alkenivorans DSM 16219]|uniref:Putative inner membrane protein n=1 Tax=Desulfatibacillum alkenivorans DSM 16219 TaxID=1121393 RepID=A0A1M6N5A4_9BACT|nr:BrxA family protein [Desulfatibacillum alkenivorans]SHJ90881.1 Putative inner membrane protein [Desulfatibacillum alkenivorans DSM 16219]